MTIDADGEEEEWLLLQEMAEQQETIRLQYPKSIRLLSLNCWGLKYISKHRRERLKEIGVQIASSNPLPDIVGLQECWTQEDYSSIVEQTRHFLPYAKYYYSGIFGSGLAILSKWPIEESSMFRYSLNGRPTAFWRGDWYVGKGVACARIRIGPLQNDVVQVFNTHVSAFSSSRSNTSVNRMKGLIKPTGSFMLHIRQRTQVDHTWSIEHRRPGKSPNFFVMQVKEVISLLEWAISTSYRVPLLTASSA